MRETDQQWKPPPSRPGAVICGRLAPPPGGYTVSHHCVKNRPSSAVHDAVCTGRNDVNAASSCGSVMLPCRYVAWICCSAALKFAGPRILRSAMYAMPGRLYVFEPENSVYGRGSDGAPVHIRSVPA